MGGKQKPFYRIVVSDARKTPTGRFLDTLGCYDPRKEPPRVQIDREKADHWIRCGAKPSNTVKQLLDKS
jgi:small subunit ribosomal protein S16